MDGFIGEIRAFAFGFVPQGWIECNGQLLPLSGQYAALFSILGITYGGNGTTTFQLPDLRGRAALGAGQGPGLSLKQLGTQYGKESVTLNVAQIPHHDHTLTLELINPASGTANMTAAANNSSWLSHPVQVTGPVASKNIPAYATGATFNSTLHSATIGIGGNSSPHENRQPYLTLMYCICSEGVYPIRP